MAGLAYRTVHAMSRTKARTAMISNYLETGHISETASRWHTLRQIAHK